MNNDLETKIYDSAIRTFEMMCYMFPLDEDEIDGGDTCMDDSCLTALVTFDGASDGGMIIRSNSDLVDAIAVNMLGSDEATPEQKQGALCEIANIVCGNIIPHFSDGEKISYIRPPGIVACGDDPHARFSGMEKAGPVRIYMDEGRADIVVYYLKNRMS
jgi:CheY-specific phosphatase CheX